MLHPFPWWSLRRWAAQDFLLAVYFGVLVLSAALGSGINARAEAMAMGAILALFVATLFFVRSPWMFGFPRVAGAIYRLVLFGAFLGSYLRLRTLLPAVTDRVADAQVYAVDLALFGFEPALSWDRFVTHERVEWFAFFYYLHFFVLAAHVFPLMLFGGRGPILARFVFGILVVFSLGHLLYLVVPGYGPFWFFRGQFLHEPLPGGYFWNLVQTAVAAGGAGKDIFPSLHTAGPSFVAMFAFVHHKHRPFCWTWIPLAIIAANIIGATLFLRWHYVIDIIAGLTLAAASVVASAHLPSREAAWRASVGLAPVFEPLFRNPFPKLFGAPATRAIFSPRSGT